MAGEPMKKYFLILPLLFLLTSCGESNIPEIDTYTWEMTSVQSGEDNGKVIAYGKRWFDTAVLDDAAELDMNCTAKDGMFTLTDLSNQNTYNGTYTLRSSNSDGSIYDVVLDGKEGIAVTGVTTYSDDTSDLTLIINLGDCTINFFAEE